MKELALAIDELLEKVDRVAFQGCQVGVALDSEKVVPEAKVMRKKVTYTSRFDRNLDANMVAVTCCYCYSANIE